MWTESIGFHAHFCQFVNRKTCDIQPNLEFRTEIEWDICATSFRKEQQSWGRQSLSDPDSRKAGYIYIYLNIYTEVVAEISSLLLLTKRPRRERPESQRNIVLWYLFEYNFDTFQESPSVGNRLQMSPKMLLFSKSTNFLPDLPFTPISFSVKWRGFSFWTSWHILPVVKSFFSASVCEILSMRHSRLPCFSYFSRSLGHVTQSVPHVDLSHVDECICSWGIYDGS